MILGRRTAFNGDISDPFLRIGTILTKNMDVATAVLFSSRIGVEYTPVHGVGTFGHEERVKQMAVLNHLTHNATQLKEIIRNYK
jgi:hypothetical protein